MQLHKSAMQQASKLNLSLLIRLLLSLRLNPYAFFRVWLLVFEIENHFLCKGGIMKNTATVPINDGPPACTGVCAPLVDANIAAQIIKIVSDGSQRQCYRYIG